MITATIAGPSDAPRAPRGSPGLSLCTMSGDNPNEATQARPARHPGVAAAIALPTITHVLRDKMSWLLGTATDIEWITSATTIDTTISSAIPPVFDAYATIVLAEDRGNMQCQGEALLSVLREQSSTMTWWLGYLDTGADDVVFPDAPRTNLYAHWPYVLVQAGPAQAATWRSDSPAHFWIGRLPNLIFPTDRSWLVSTLWDDDWTCIGGSAALIEALTDRPELRRYARRVDPGQDATPPGHHAI
jgi:hypothetical protein